MTWLQWATLGMQFLILFFVVGSAFGAHRAYKTNKLTLNAIREYRREIGWLTSRLEALEQSQQKTKGQGNVGVEASRGK
jgi:hypothetical protein